MNQLDLLWEYQQADMEAERQENTMKRSPTRQRLLKYQEYLREQKAANVHLQQRGRAVLYSGDPAPDPEYLRV